jgi:hypothetical protein
MLSKRWPGETEGHIPVFGKDAKEFVKKLFKMKDFING